MSLQRPIVYESNATESADTGCCSENSPHGFIACGEVNPVAAEPYNRSQRPHLDKMGVQVAHHLIRVQIKMAFRCGLPCFSWTRESNGDTGVEEADAHESQYWEGPPDLRIH